MKKLILFGLFIIGILVIGGCAQQANQQPIICNSPYIKMGTSCCLDANNNRICDSDESTVTSDTGLRESKSIGSIQEAYDIFIKNGNKIWSTNNPACPYSNNLYAIVYVNRESQSVECKWMDNDEATYIKSLLNADPKTTIEGSGNLVKYQELVNLLNECNLNTYKVYDEVYSNSEWFRTGPAGNLIDTHGLIVSAKKFYVAHIHCREKFIYFNNEVLDATNGILLTAS